MKKVYGLLLQVVNEEKMSQKGIYIDYRSSLNDLAEAYDMNVKSKEFIKEVYDVFSVSVDELKDIDFITFENSNAFGGHIFGDPETAFNDIIYFILNESEYRKYIDHDKLEEIKKEI